MEDYIKILDTTPDYNGKLKVEIKSDNDLCFTTYMTKEEYKLRATLIALKETIGVEAVKELGELIEDFGQEKYNEGCDNTYFECNDRGF